MPEEDEFEVSVKASERRECPHCRQETTWNLNVYKKWFGLRKEEYWACGRCGKPESAPAPDTN